MQEVGERVEYAIGRPIGGVYLNGIEYLLDDDGDVRKFPSRGACLNFIQNELGIEGPEAEDYVFEFDEGIYETQNDD